MLYIYIYIYIICSIYFIYIQGYYLNFLDIYKLFTVKQPLILLYFVI